LNDPFREIYREHRKLNGESFPDYLPTDAQADNMIKLIELLQEPNSSNWLEIAELSRELGDFETANEALSIYKGAEINKLKDIVGRLIDMKVSTPARFKWR
jgi:hypothetical protein